MAWKNIPEKKVLATLKDGKDFKGAAAEKMTIYVDGEIPGSEGDVKGVSVTVDPSTYVMTTQLKDGKGGNVGSPATVDLPLESMVVGGEYDDATKKVILTLKNGETVEFSVADLVAGLQSEITPQNPLSADLVAESINKEFVTHSEKMTIEQLDDAGVTDIARMLQSENETGLDSENGDSIHFIMESQGGVEPTGLTVVTPAGQINLEQGVSGDINSHTFGDECDAQNMRAGTYSYNPVGGTDLYIDSAHTVQVTEAGTLIVGEPSNDEQTVLFIPADGSGVKTYYISLLSGEVEEKSVGSGNVGRYLTSGDYNWNSQTKTATEPYNAVALWLMEPGIYLNTPNNTGLSVFTTRDTSVTNGGTFFVMNRGTNGTENELATILYVDGLNPSIRAVNVQKNNGASYFETRTLITSEDVVNNLISTSGTTPLSANQGKVLNEKIGDLSSLETTDKSSLVDAINEVAEGGSGGGGVLTLYMLDLFNTYPTEVGDHLEFCRDKELTDPITATELDAALNEGKVVQINCLYNAGDDWGPNYVTITDFYDDGSYGSDMFFTLRSRNSDAGYRVKFLGDNDYAIVIEKETYDVQADWNEASDNSSAFIKNKPTIPSKVSDLTNDSGYQNASQVSSAIASAVGDITSFEYQVVQALPQSGEKGVIYLVANSGTTPNIYDEYIWVNNTFEKIGTTDIDLSGYATTQDLEDGLATKADAIDPSDLPSGSTQNGVITTSDHTDIDPSVVSEGQIVVDSTDGKVYIVSEITTDPQTGDPVIVWKEIQTDEEVIYVDVTVTDVQTMAFTVDGYTANDICVLLDAGVNVIYRLSLTQSLPGLAAGVYDFRPIMHASSGGYGGVMSSMVGPSGNNTVLGVASHVDNGTSSFEMRYLQNKIDSDHKLSADLIDSSNSDDKTYQTGTGAPTTSTEGSVGEMYVDKSTGTVYVCTDNTGGTYTWSEVSGEGGGLVELTSADYDYPTANPDGVALWNLDDGIYQSNDGVKVYAGNGTGENYSGGGVYIISTVSSGRKNIQVFGSVSTTDSSGRWAHRAFYKVNSSGSGTSVSNEFVTADIANDLQTTSIYKALGASQGKILNEKIPVITMQTTDPGEGVSLAANNFIAVYEA